MTKMSKHLKRMYRNSSSENDGSEYYESQKPNLEDNAFDKDGISADVSKGLNLSKDRIEYT